MTHMDRDGFDHPDARRRVAVPMKAFPWFGLALSVAAFVADLWLPRGVGAGPIYVLCVLTTVGHPSRNTTIGMALVTTLETVIAAAWPAMAGGRWLVGTVDAGFTIAAIWGAASFLLAYGRTNLRVAEVEDREKTEETWLAQTLASIGDGVIAVDRSGNVKFMNKVAERLTGWQAASAVGKPLDAVFAICNEQTGETIPNPAGRALEDGVIAGLPGPTVLQSRTGEVWPIDDSASPIRDDDGNVCGSVMVFREITDRRKSEQAMELRLRESGHRIRNVFANMRALLKLCERTADTPAELVTCVELRITSLVRSTERLMRTEDGAASSHDIIVGELSPYLDSHSDRLHVSGDVMISAEHSVPFAMIVHELANNAAKYGSLSNEDGRVEVRLKRQNAGEIALEWRELDGPPVSEPGRAGLGSQLISGLVRIQFSGQWNPEYTPVGFRCTLVLRLPANTAEPEPVD